MDWYYADGKNHVGPMNEEVLDGLASEGTINAQTLVWAEGMAEWQPYAAARAAGAPAAVAAAASVDGAAEFACAECGQQFRSDDMVQYGQSWVCARCKPAFVPKLTGGEAVALSVQFGGFWIRFAAKFLDWIVLWIVNMTISFVLSMFIGMGNGEPNATLAFLSIVLPLVVNIAYVTWFLGTYAATPGKMACGLKVITADGGRVSYARAFGRFFGEWLSSMILGIGYIIAAFDDEKRTLHDRVCNTRVIRK